MGILFWYILRQYLQTLALCIMGLTTIYLVIDFFEKLRKFLRYDAEISSMLLYFFFKIPEISFKLAPFAVLMATLLTIGVLNRNQEITALRSCGFSLWHLSAPFFAVAVCATGVLFGFTAVIIPVANAKAEYIKTIEITGKPQPLAFTAQNLWLRIQNNTIIHVKEVIPDGMKLRGIHLYRLDPKFHVREILAAQDATYNGRGWTLHQVTQRVISSGPVQITQRDQLPLELSLTPEDLQTWISLEPEHMTLDQLSAHIEHLKQERHTVANFLTDYWGRIALAFVTLIMTILGIALGLRGLDARGRSVAKGIGQALGISFLFWTTHSVGIALGRSGALIPVVAGWIACLMFLSVSLNFFLKIRY